MNISKTRQYRIWAQMKSRCDNPNNSKYEIYGGSGIAYDKKWKTFYGFWEDMQDGYSDELTIDRIDPTLGYSKENCRWATYEQQNNNKSDNLNLTYYGDPITVNQISEITGLNKNTIRSRLDCDWSVEKIIRTPKLENGDKRKAPKLNPIKRLDIDGNVIGLFANISMASRHLPLSRTVITKILKGKRKKDDGYYFEYVN